MLGSLSEAEDVVQDAWLRWQRADHSAVAAPPAFLSRVVTRLCLDVMKSARRTRETYVGPWLPEPLVDGLSLPEPVPDADDLTLTLMLALERLSPLERAAFLLHDVFGVPLNEVAGVTCTTQPASPARYTASTVPSPPVYFTSSYPSAGSTSAMAACLVFSAFASM